MTEKKRDVQIVNADFKEAEVVRNRWSAVLKSGQTYDDLMTPRFWAHQARMMANGDIIEVRTEEEDHYGEFIVVEANRVEVRVHKLSWIPLGNADVKEVLDEDYAYKWKGPTLKHCVIRKMDGAVIVEKLPTKADAVQWIATRRAAA